MTEHQNTEDTYTVETTVETDEDGNITVTQTADIIPAGVELTALEIDELI